MSQTFDIAPYCLSQIYCTTLSVVDGKNICLMDSVPVGFSTQSVKASHNKSEAQKKPQDITIIQNSLSRRWLALSEMKHASKYVLDHVLGPIHKSCLHHFSDFEPSAIQLQPFCNTE